MKAVWGTLLLLLVSLITVAQAREHIRIVGSSTVFPFAAVLAERFGQSSQFPSPVLEATGSGGGIRFFCSGVGVRSADIVSASRAMTDYELNECAINQVGDVIEIQLGYDALVVANQRLAPELALTRADLYQALARQIPDPDTGLLMANPHRAWQDIRPDLPDMPIRIYGPPPTSGTRDAFVAQVMLPGCRTEPSLVALADQDVELYRQACEMLREDGVFIEAGESDAFIVSRLDTDATALGIFGYSFLKQNADRVKSLSIEGMAATEQSLAKGLYPVIRPLFLYVKASHLGVIPGLDAFVSEVISPQALGQGGYLQARGLIPMTEEVHYRMRQSIEHQMHKAASR
ncbi:MAG: substrate-binding domain-containing protein [Saccharospirillum sp.]|nr:substrate-binding domain-containing protein [Saccharospirillum sp.]